MIAVVTKFKLNRQRSYPRFMWLTALSGRQAWNDPNCLNFRLDPFRLMTISVWQDMDSMKRYALSGDHLKAMNESKSLGHGECVKWITHDKPTWKEAIERLAQ